MTSSYLIKAPDEDLLAWKQAAKDEGLTLAAWIRRRLNGEPTLDIPNRDVEHHEKEAVILAADSPTVYEEPREETLSERLARLTAARPERTFKPDPKPSKTEKKRR